MQKKKRKTAATGKPRKALKSEELLLQHVGQMTEHIGSISQVLMGETKMDENDNTLKRGYHQHRAKRGSGTHATDKRYARKID